jgi:hypothetical protein
MPINYGSNDVSTSGLITANSLQVNGLSTFITNNTTPAINVSGVAKFGNGFNGYVYFGDDFFGGELGFFTNYDEVLAAKSTNGSFHYGGGSPTAGNLVVTSSGNVGIGTATPSSALHVNGDITCNNIIPSDPGNTFFRVGTSLAYLDLNIDNLGIGTDGDISMVCGGNINLTPDSTAAIYLNSNVNIDGNLTFDSYTESVVSNGNSGASKTLSLASGTVHTCTLTNNCTFTMPTATAGKSFSMFLNSGSGNYTASFSGVRWADSATPTATITASKVDIYSFISDGSFWYGSFSQNYG